MKTPLRIIDFTGMQFYQERPVDQRLAKRRVSRSSRTTKNVTRNVRGVFGQIFNTY